MLKNRNSCCSTHSNSIGNQNCFQTRKRLGKGLFYLDSTVNNNVKLKVSKKVNNIKRFIIIYYNKLLIYNAPIKAIISNYSKQSLPNLIKYIANYYSSHLQNYL